MTSSNCRPAAAALRDHALERLLRNEEGSEQVDVEHALPVRPGLIKSLHGGDDCSAGHDMIEPAEFFVGKI
jgi:hypothetical protein